MRFNMKEIYKDRLMEIDYQINKAIRNRTWKKKKELEVEKKDLILKLELMEHRINKVGD